MALTRKEQMERRWVSLKNERSSFLSHWRDLSEQIRPRGSRFLVTDRNKGTKVNSSIINNTPTVSARTLAAGMMSGITSPSRPWFRLTTPDPVLAEIDSVKVWLHAVEERIRLTLAKSNCYNSLHQLYSDLGVHGVGVVHVDEDDEKVIHSYVYPIGSYCLATNAKGEVDTCFRETSLSVKQMVERFTKAKCSLAVQRMFDQGELDTAVVVLHAVAPNEDFKPGQLGPTGKRFSSCWMELGQESVTDFLLEAGYDDAPFMAPRWSVVDGDAYGDSPGMASLGDCRALQLYEKRSAEISDKTSSPAMKGPASLRGTVASLLPGSMTYLADSQPGQTFEPVFTPDPRAIEVIQGKIQQCEQRIKETFYATLWLMLSQADSRMTATEVVARKEEALLQLGTVLERLQTELLDKLISRIFSVLLRKSLIPKPPEELQGRELRVEYVSVLAAAQRAHATTGIERASSFVANLSAVKPDALDTLDFDQVVTEYSSSLGVPPQIVRSDDQVQLIRQQRAKAAQAQQQMAQAQEASVTAKNLGQAPVGQDSNALNELLRGIGARS